MACSNPLKGFKGKNGKLVFTREQSTMAIKMEVPCGQCWSCRLARSLDWAVRLVKESLSWPHDRQLFLTLTYNDLCLPKTLSISKTTMQQFIKNLRFEFSYRKLNPETGRMKTYWPKIKYFLCGEYGTTCSNCGKNYIFHEVSKSNKPKNDCKHYHAAIGRPHYHIILYGIKFQDQRFWKNSTTGEPLYKSQQLDDLWANGYCIIGKVTYNSCAYVARYIMKKITGKLTDGHYLKPQLIDEESGEILEYNIREPEFILMSRRPAIAEEYINKYTSDVFPHDRIITLHKKGAKISKPPRYFTKQLKKLNPEMAETIKQRRTSHAKKNASSNTQARNEIKERCKKAQTKNLARHYEENH